MLVKLPIKCICIPIIASASNVDANNDLTKLIIVKFGCKWIYALNVSYLSLAGARVRKVLL